MFDPIERRNAAGDAIESLKIQEWETGAVRLVTQDGGGIGSIELDDAALDEAITQLCIARNNRRATRQAAQQVAEAVAERQGERLENAAWRGYGGHGLISRFSADGDRLIDRVR
jgi:hypothetical protein